MNTFSTLKISFYF